MKVRRRIKRNVSLEKLYIGRNLGRRELRAQLESTHVMTYVNEQNIKVREVDPYDDRGGQLERVDRVGTQGQGEASQFRCKSRKTRRREAERKRAALKQPWRRQAEMFGKRGQR